MESRNRGSSDLKKPAWKSQGNGLASNRDLANIGILAVKEASYRDLNASLDSFPLGSHREFSYFDPNGKDKSHTKKRAKKGRALLGELTKFSSDESAKLNDMIPFIYNKMRREEAFIPFEISEGTGLYTFPWLSKNLPFNFNGFSEFVTAGCLFGSSLKGANSNGFEASLIKHDIDFKNGYKFDHIKLHSETQSPYEEILFKELKTLCQFINTYSKRGLKEKKLRYHLPYYDYILFGAELFLKGRITLEALNDLFNIILERKYEFSKKIRIICDRYDVTVQIESPFENLFGTIIPTKSVMKSIFHSLDAHIQPSTLADLEERDYQEIEKWLASETLTTKEKIKLVLQKCHTGNEIDLNLLSIEKQRTLNDTFQKCISGKKLAIFILDALDIHKEEKDPEALSENDQIVNEKNLVQSCFRHLCDNNYNPSQKQTWSKFIKLIDLNRVNNLEDLFKLANAFMIMHSAQGKEDNETCSFLPVTEKQIQVSYQSHSKLAAQQKMAVDLPSVFNITFLDPLLAYSRQSKGQVFYFNQSPGTLSDLIINKLDSIYKITASLAINNRSDGQEQNEPEDPDTTSVSDLDKSAQKKAVSIRSNGNHRSPDKLHFSATFYPPHIKDSQNELHYEPSLGPPAPSPITGKIYA